LINTEDLFVRNVFLNLLTVTFVVEADDILGILLFESETREQPEISEDGTFGSYWWPRALVFLPVAFSIVLIFLNDNIINHFFPEKIESCAVMILSSTNLVQVTVPFFACIFDFSASEWFKNDVNTSLKERFIVATEYVPCVIYSISLANLLPPIGALLYEKSGIAYFQTSLGLKPVNCVFPLISAVFVFITDFFRKRLNTFTNQNDDDFMGNILLMSLWFHLLFYLPFVLLFYFVGRRN